MKTGVKHAKTPTSSLIRRPVADQPIRFRASRQKRRHHHQWRNHSGLHEGTTPTLCSGRATFRQTRHHLHNGSTGYGILGPDAGQPWPQSVGCGFKPKATHVVTEIQVGVTYVQGTNTMVLSLREDHNQRPGKVLHSWHFSNLPNFGTCCTLQTAKYAKGIPVTKGKMYWVVVAPDPKHTDTYDVWDNAYNDPSGAFSNNIGSGWTQQSYQTLSNFGVFGK
jgi:hypothetical protein